MGERKCLLLLLKSFFSVNCTYICHKNPKIMALIRYNSPVVLTFSILSTIVYFLNEAMAQSLTPLFSLSPIFDFSSVSNYFSLFLYVVGHGSVDHLLGNMSFILLLGPILEEKYGSKNLLIMLLFTALATAILNLLFFNTGILGASGIVFMFILLVSFTNNKQGSVPLTFILILILYIGKEIYNGFQTDNVSQFGHIVGGICGSLFGFLGIVKELPDKQDTYFNA